MAEVGSSIMVCLYLGYHLSTAYTTPYAIILLSDVKTAQFSALRSLAQNCESSVRNTDERSLIQQI